MIADRTDRRLERAYRGYDSALAPPVGDRLVSIHGLRRSRFRLGQSVPYPAEQAAEDATTVPLAVDDYLAEVTQPAARDDPRPVLNRSSISQACLAAHRAQGRHSATSG